MCLINLFLVAAVSYFGITYKYKISMEFLNRELFLTHVSAGQLEFSCLQLHSSAESSSRI